MTPIEEAILHDSSLDDRDVRILLTVSTMQEKGLVPTHQQVADRLKVHHTTVSRRIRKLKEAELISSKRVSSKVWEYDFCGYSEEVPMQVGAYAQNNVASQSEPQEDIAVGDSAKVPMHLGAYAPDEIIQINNKNNIFNTNRYVPISLGSKKYDHTVAVAERTTMFNLEIPSSLESSQPKGESMPRVIGPPGKLNDVATGILERPSKVRERYQVKKSTQHESFAEKHPSEYNCNDMWFVYRDLWHKTFRGLPTQFTIRDKSNLKNMINNYGAEDVVKMLGYVFERWNDLCRTFHVQGYPCVSVIFGFRRSWMPEALNGKPAPTWGAEYDKSKPLLPAGCWKRSE